MKENPLQTIPVLPNNNRTANHSIHTLHYYEHNAMSQANSKDRKGD